MSFFVATLKRGFDVYEAKKLLLVSYSQILLRDGELREHPRLRVGVHDAYEVRYGFYCQSDKSGGEQRISMNIERVIQRDAVERSGGGIC